jgi:hypothetical protein
MNFRCAASARFPLSKRLLAKTLGSVPNPHKVLQVEFANDTMFASEPGSATFSLVFKNRLQRIWTSHNLVWTSGISMSFRFCPATDALSPEWTPLGKRKTNFDPFAPLIRISQGLFSSATVSNHGQPFSRAGHGLGSTIINYEKIRAKFFRRWLNV